MKKIICAGVVCALAMAMEAPAHATTFSVLGGISSGNGSGYGASNPSPLVGGEITFGLADIFQLGAFYDYNFLSYGGGGMGSVQFMGGIARLGLGSSGFFLDGEVGPTITTGSSAELGIGGGVGYRFNIVPMVDISPRFGIRDVPNGSATQNLLDFGILLSFGF